MTRPPVESMPQKEVLLRLRAAIDTAIKHPTQTNIDKAIKITVDHPQAMRSSHVSHNLGVRRWEWLGEYGVYFPGEGSDAAGTVGFTTNISEPPIKK